MKETAKQQLEILNTKRGNIVNNINNINLKILTLQAQLEKEEKALERIENTIANFGKKKAKESSNQSEESPSPTGKSEEKESLSN